MRRTKATLIYRRTNNLRAVQLLPGHSTFESTVRYLGIEVDHALEISEQAELYCRQSLGANEGSFRANVWLLSTTAVVRADQSIDCNQPEAASQAGVATGPFWPDVEFVDFHANLTHRGCG